LKSPQIETGWAGYRNFELFSISSDTFFFFSAD